MRNFGVKISKDGFDVKTATQSQLSMSSKFDSLKVKQKVTTQVTILNGVTDVTHTFAHGLSYVPAFACFVSEVGADAYFAIPWYDPGILIFAQILDIDTWIDGTNLSVRLQGFGGGNETLDLRYFIFYNQLDS